MPHTDKTCYDRTRLYFLVYICDHQLSLSHGRPPMTREIRIMKEPRTLLESRFSTPLDLPLVSQVELWSISTQVFDNFGAATDCPFTSRKLSELQYFSDPYEHWHQEWIAMLKDEREMGQSYPAILDLYFHSARLCLSSHIFRGPEQDFARPKETPNLLDIFSLSATQSALSIVSKMTELNEAEACSRLPFYFSTTIAFACIFLLRGPCRALYHVDRDQVRQYLQALDRLVTSPLTIPIAAHPVSNIANSLKAALDGWRENEEGKDGRTEEAIADISMYHESRAYGLVSPNAQDCAYNDFGLDLASLQSFDFDGVNWNV